MPKENLHALQYHMFQEKRADTRTRRQKNLAKKRAKPTQMEMFSPREVADPSVNAKPLIDLGPIKLQLQMQDFRTPEEIVADNLKKEQEATYSYLPDQGVKKQDIQPVKSIKPQPGRKTWDFPSSSLELIHVEEFDTDPTEPVEKAAVRLTDHLNVLLWNTPEEEAARLDLLHRGAQYRYRVRGEMLEINHTQGSFRISYNELGMIQDICWDTS